MGFSRLQSLPCPWFSDHRPCIDVILAGFVTKKKPHLCDAASSQVTGANEESTAIAAQPTDNSPYKTAELDEEDVMSLSEVLGVSDNPTNTTDVSNIHSCQGLHYSQLNVSVPPDYDFIRDYPFSIHSTATQTAFESTNFIPNITWTVDTNGAFKSQGCFGFVVEPETDRGISQYRLSRFLEL
eukprot:scaffold46517_cov47-Cyclotella_meneghiniana.AAC.1